MMIRDALNKQTAMQFRQYAEQQFPGDTAQASLPSHFRQCWFSSIIVVLFLAKTHITDISRSAVTAWQTKESMKLSKSDLYQMSSKLHIHITHLI